MQYGVRDVQRLLQLSRSTIRSLVQAGFVTPGRGTRREWRFSFQDLIVLRTAQTLARAKVPARRIARSMRALRSRLPEAMPLSGLSIGAEADRVVVKEGRRRWQAESGQYLLAFDGDPASGTLNVIERAPAPKADADDYIKRGLSLHEGGDLRAAERAYRDGLEACGRDPTLLFNLALVLEDAGRPQEALATYGAALEEDPRFADCHYNIALLYETLGDRAKAIRHLAQYRRLGGRT
jgi:tetratricopeptide (TPR) repeat protein